MASSYSTRLRLEKQGTGENSNSWGERLNTNLIDMVDEAIAGRAAVTHDNAASYTLSTANCATDEARKAILDIGGALTAARNTVVPTQSKLYVAKNATTGGFATTLKTSGGTGISIPNGKTTLLMCDGTNVVDAIDYLSALTVGGALSVGTTLTVVGALTPQALVDISGAAAGQIKFPATQNASSNANTLDDYEEGTFTPTILGSSGHAPGTYFAQIGRYTKVGNRVDWSLEMQINGYGTLINGETLRIQGFPFTLGIGAGYPGVICGRLNGSAPAPLSTASWPHVVQVDGDTDIYLYKSGAEDSLLKEDIASNQPLFASGTIWV